MWKWKPSAISATPTRSRNDSASILTVGWLLTKSPTGLAATSMTIMAMTTAVIMIGSWSVMPTAVMIESSANTTSRMMIWTTAAAKVVVPTWASCLLALEHVVGLHRPLHQQEQPADDQHDVAPGEVEAEDGEHRLGEPDDPGQREQQRDPARAAPGPGRAAAPAAAGAWAAGPTRSTGRSDCRSRARSRVRSGSTDWPISPGRQATRASASFPLLALGRL